MTPRDRVLAALNGEEVFPIPTDVWCNSMYPEVEAGLYRHFGIPEGHYDRLLDRLGSHERWTSPIYIGPPQPEDPTIPVRYPHTVAKLSIWGTWDGPEIYTGFLRPLEHAETVADVEAHTWPNPDWFDYHTVGGLRYPEERLVDWSARNADYMRVGSGFWQPIFSRLSDLFGMEKALLNMALNPKVIHAAIAYITDYLEEFYRRLAEAGRGHYDVINFGDDFASQRALLMSPAMWREFFKPSWERLFAVAHAHGMRTSYHSCGAVRAVIGDLIDAGLDILDVVQISASGMDPHEL
ncbi:MAG: hypothetical protein IT326_05040, partial [Anaerolineae bacterium]|nr:hypothetical protein [Anaerolineae bacterium]